MNEHTRSATQSSMASDMPITVRVWEACRLTGISRSKLYELIKAGKIERLKVGNMTLIPTNSLTAFLNKSRKKETGF